jgi:Concanavalin A-like lectin/glucanases superfamily
MENFQAAPRSEAVLNILHELTVEAWINISNLGSAPQAILAKGILDYDGTSYNLQLNPQGKVQWGVRHSHVYFGEVGDWSIDGIITDTALRPNTWYHLACTIYSSRSASIYVNGVLAKTGAITQSILSKPTEPLQIGFILHYGTPSFHFNGLIDEVMIYDRVLPLDEIQKHYQDGLKRHRK